MSNDQLTTGTEPTEVHTIVGKILQFVAENAACSEEILIAALKVAAITVEETKLAQIGAQVRAGMVAQYRVKR